MLILIFIVLWFLFFSFLRLSGDSNSGYDSGYSGRDSEASSGVSNPDLQASVPQILQHLEAIHSQQQQLLQLWHHKKLKLDQCFQLRLFEQDCDKVQHLFPLAPCSSNLNTLALIF